MADCTVPGCPNEHAARGYCQAHYARWKRWGDPLSGTYVEPIDKRFWSKVAQPPSLLGCLIWTGAKTPDGYGQFWDGTWRAPRRPRLVRAHRWVYERKVGPIPEGMEVCHSCDNPPCVNWLHLFVCTHFGNMADSAAKGRQGVNRGERNGRAKVTAEDVASMRARATGKHGEVSAFAREYGLSTGTISKILNRQIWA